MNVKLSSIPLFLVLLTLLFGNSASAFVARQQYATAPALGDSTLAPVVLTLSARQPSQLLMSNVEQETKGEVNGTSETEGDEVTPHPPNYPPPALSANLEDDYKTLKEQTEARDAFVKVLENKVEKLMKEMQEKEAELKKQSGLWNIEKTSMMAKIAEFSDMLQQKEEEDEEEKYQKQRLQTEVKLLQEQIEKVRSMLKREQQAAEELKARLEDVGDAMEFQQMEFEKEKKELEGNVEEEKKKLDRIIAQWEDDKKRFEQEKQKIQAQLKKEVEQLEEATSEWNANKQEYEDQRKNLQEELVIEKTKLSDTRKEMKSQTKAFSEERAALKAMIQGEQEKIREVEKTLQKEKVRFEQAQLTLQQKIQDERDVVMELSQRLIDEEQRYQEEKTNLEVALELERKRLSELGEELAGEKINFAAEQERLEAAIAEEVRLRRLKKRQMHDRYEEIRKELTSLWVGAKRDARRERKFITDKYEKKLTSMNEKMRALQADLRRMRESSDELQVLLTESRKREDQAKLETRKVEERYTMMVAQRNREIASLKDSVKELRDTIRLREDQIDQYESSFRELVKLSVKVTGKKLSLGKSKVAGWFRRRRKDDE